MNKITSRLRRAKRARKHIQSLDVPRMSVFRSSRHIYVQVISPDAKVIASASTKDKELAASVVNGGNKAAAVQVGQLIASRCADKGVKKVAFDRSGFQFHGRIKALADAAREGGMEF